MKCCTAGVSCPHQTLQFLGQDSSALLKPLGICCGYHVISVLTRSYGIWCTLFPLAVHAQRGVKLLLLAWRMPGGIYISANSEFQKYSLSEVHSNAGRLLFEVNRLQYTLAAPEVFVASGNPVSLPSGYRVSIVRNTNIDQIETTPLR